MCSTRLAGNATLGRGAPEGRQQSQNLGREVHAPVPALHAVAMQGMGALPIHPSAKGLQGLSAESGKAPCTGYCQAGQEWSLQCWAHWKAKGAAVGC